MHNKHAVLAFAPNDWHGLWMNRQQLLSRITDIANVTYSNGPLFSWDLRGKGKNNPLFVGKKMPSRDHTDVMQDVPAKLSMRIPKIPFIDEIHLSKNGKRYSNILQKDVVGNGKKILYIFHPMYAEYVDVIEYDHLVYHCYDNFITMEESGEQWINAEKKLCAKANLIFASSEFNRDRIAESYNRPDAEFLPNGVDLPLFLEAKAKVPEAILSQLDSKKKKVGYIGSVNDKVDLNVVDHITEELDDLQFVFVGRCNNLSKENQSLWGKITKRNNVVYHSGCQREEVPSVLKLMDVNCIYYDTKGDNFSSAGYPLKLHEYMASGKPAISAKIRAVLAFDSVVRVADSNQEWVEALRQAVDDPEHAPSGQADRIETATNNSWDKRAEVLKTRILNL